MRFDYDDDILDIINEINSELIEHGLQISLREEELDGYELGDIIESDELIQI